VLTVCKGVLGPSLVAALLTTGCGGGSLNTASITEVKDCLTSRGFEVDSRPNLGVAAVPADDWFSATKDNVEINIAYFSGDEAEAAQAQLRLIAQSTGEAMGITVTDENLDDVLRRNGSVLYWWSGDESTYAADVEDCL
jgi:hypothetical protein